MSGKKFPNGTPTVQQTMSFHADRYAFIATLSKRHGLAKSVVLDKIIHRFQRKAERKAKA